MTERRDRTITEVAEALRGAGLDLSMGSLGSHVRSVVEQLRLARAIMANRTGRLDAIATLAAEADEASWPEDMVIIYRLAKGTPDVGC